MKFPIQTILLLALGYLAQGLLYLPFWSLAVVCFLVGLFFKYRNSLTSFAAGFLGASLLWGGMAWLQNSANMGSMAGQLGELFSVSGNGLLWATAWLGGMIGGLGAMTGTLARKVFVSENTELAEG